MKYFSMFSGIGGFELGIQNAYRNKNAGSKGNPPEDEKTGQGLVPTQGQDTHSTQGSTGQYIDDTQRGCEPSCVGYSEIDRYADSIYRRHFKGHKNYEDARNINPGELADFDLLVGGFPCQAFSIAGKRGGFDDTRGTLFFEIARIIKEKLPRLLLLENVKGLLSHDKGQTFGTILNTLDELGYDILWQVLNSKNFGVPQNRERVFIIGCLRGTGRTKVFPLRENPTKTQIELLGTTKGENCTRIGERDVVMSKDGLCGALKATDYKQPPQLLELTKKVHQGKRVYDPAGISTTITSQGGGLGAKTGLYTIPPSNLYENCRVRRLTPVECERLQGFPDNWTQYGVDGKQISDTQRYKCLGNAVTVNVIQAIMERLLPIN